jgi:hypothetical protein
MLGRDFGAARATDDMGKGEVSLSTTLAGPGQKATDVMQLRIPNRPTLRSRHDDGPALGNVRHRRPSEEERPVAAGQNRLSSCCSHVGLDSPVKLLGRDVRDVGDGVLRGDDESCLPETNEDRRGEREIGSLLSRRGELEVRWDEGTRGRGDEGTRGRGDEGTLDPP